MANWLTFILFADWRSSQEMLLYYSDLEIGRVFESPGSNVAGWITTSDKVWESPSPIRLVIMDLWTWLCNEFGVGRPAAAVNGLFNNSTSLPLFTRLVSLFSRLIFHQKFWRHEKHMVARGCYSREVKLMAYCQVKIFPFSPNSSQVSQEREA